MRFKFEVSHDEVRISGPGAQVLLTGFLTRAKFGEAYDPLTLLNPTLADWLKAVAPPPRPSPVANVRYGQDFIQGVAEAIFRDSSRLGWFRWTEVEQIAFLKDVVAAPNNLPDEDVAEIRETIDHKLYWARRLVEAADGAEHHAEP
jgi:hypothetical protein